MSTPVSVGKYQLIRKLAAGGMAEVFLARAAGPMGFEKQVVVKRILPHLADEQNFISMFLSEARLAAQLNHPNVVQVFDFGQADGAWFLVMEFIDGVNLRVLFRKAHERGEPLPFPLVARIISLACEGLAYAHEFADPGTGEELGLVHRDVSPDNVLIARNGSVKVVDFGIAKAANQTNLTKTGTVKGKFSYMPPEQLTGQPLDKRADVFALGIVLYELLTGRKPFDTSNEAFIVRAIMYEPMAAAAQFRPDVPPALQQVLDRALAKERDQRYPDCRAFQHDLERFILSTGEPVSQHQLAQLVQRVVPATPVHTPAPSAPPPVPMGPPPVAATVEDLELQVSTALLATPPPQDSVIALVPKRPAAAPPVPTQTMPVPTPAGARAHGAEVPMMPQPSPPHEGSWHVSGPGEVFPRSPPAPAQVVIGEASQSSGLSGTSPRLPRPSAPQPTTPDVGAISLRDEQSAERDLQLVRPKRSFAVPLLVVALLVGAGGTWAWLHRTPEVALEPPPTPPAPQPVVVAPPAPEPVAVAPAPEPVKPEPIAEPVPPEPARLPEPVKPAVALKVPVPKKPAVAVKKPETAAAKTAPVEFRVRPFGAVWVDGKFLGETPFAPAAIAIGAHQVRVVNRDLGKEVTKPFEVKDGANVFRHSFED